MNKWIGSSRALLVALALVGAVTPAWADAKGEPPAAAAGKKPDDKAAKPDDKAAKPDDKAAKPDDKAAKLDEKAAKLDEKAAKLDEKAAKLDEKAEKLDDKAAKLDEKAGKPASPGKSERAEKAKAERAELRGKVEKALKGQPMTAAMREEIKRHARRLARLERVKAVAAEAKDDAAVERADKLIKKENARHDKWMTGYDAKAGAK